MPPEVSLRNLIAARLKDPNHPATPNLDEVDLVEIAYGLAVAQFVRVAIAGSVKPNVSVPVLGLLATHRQCQSRQDFVRLRLFPDELRVLQSTKTSSLEKALFAKEPLDSHFGLSKCGGISDIIQTRREL